MCSTCTGRDSRKHTLTGTRTQGQEEPHKQKTKTIQPPTEGGGLAAPAVTGKGHRKIEPKAKHFSHCKKDQPSRSNQTNNLKRLAKISNHAYKNSEKNQILFIDNLDHKPTIDWISTNTPQKVLHRIDLQEHRGELCIEHQRERRSHLANNYRSECLW